MNEPVWFICAQTSLLYMFKASHLSFFRFRVLGIPLDKGREESGARGGGGAPGGQAPVLASSRSTASMAAAHEPARGSGGASFPLDPLDWLSTSSMQVLTTAAIPSAQAPLDWLSTSSMQVLTTAPISSPQAPLDWLSAPAWVAAAAAAAAAVAVGVAVGAVAAVATFVQREEGCGENIG